MNALQFIFLILVVFPLIWLGVTYLLAFTSGWRTLAKHYRTNQQPEGYTQKMVSGNFGWTGGYNNILTVTITKKGLYLSISIFFRLTNPPVFIPWEHIELLGKQKLLWLVRQQLIVYTPIGKRIVKISLPRSIFEETDEIIPYDIDGSK